MVRTNLATSTMPVGRFGQESLILVRTKIVTLGKYNNDTVLVLKDRSWGLISNIRLDLSQVTLDMRTDGAPARFDVATKGKVWRLGNDYWTLLDSNIPIKVGGRDIPVGLWYLGLSRSDDVPCLTITPVLGALSPRPEPGRASSYGLNLTLDFFAKPRPSVD